MQESQGFMRGNLIKVAGGLSDLQVSTVHKDRGYVQVGEGVVASVVKLDWQSHVCSVLTIRHSRLAEVHSHQRHRVGASYGKR